MFRVSLLLFLLLGCTSNAEMWTEIQFGQHGILTLESDGFYQIMGSVLGTFLRQDYVELVKKIKKKHKVKKILVIHPFEGIQKLKTPGVFVYITEEKTQVFAVNKEMFALSGSFSPGGNRFRDIFQKEFGMIENIAEEFEEQYTKGNLSEQVRAKIHSFILPEVHNFGTLVREKLRNVKMSTAQHVFLFGAGVRFKEILQLFALEDEVNIPSQEKSDLEILMPKDFHNKIVLPGELDARYTPVLLLTEVMYAKETY